MDAVWFGLSLSVWFVYSAALLVVDAQLGGGGGLTAAHWSNVWSWLKTLSVAHPDERSHGFSCVQTLLI